MKLPKLPKLELKPCRTSKEKAQRLVHRYAAFGTAWAVLPIPGATSTGLAALEAHMIYWIARYYGETPSHTDVIMTMSGLELASVALKTVAIEGANLVPVVGWGVKGAIAASVVEGIGAAIIHHFEEKYPGRLLDGQAAAAPTTPTTPPTPAAPS
jgi:uncharacterized protein (DUF697 family)